MTTKKLGWSHPIDESDQWDGFNEPGIEHFAGNPVRHLAREVNQNSLDSADDGTVRVEMKLSYAEVKSIPDFEQLKKTIKLCKDAASKESSKAQQFFQGAHEELAKSKIYVLEISDFNTRGMRGPCENGTPYYAFMKAKGQSKKESATATGSFGIGKFAPYSVSKLRTVFVSTVYEETSGAYRQLTQGKSILMSHDDGKKRRQGTGFWGNTEKCQPVEGVSKEMPAWLQRARTEAALKKSKGTQLSILGFDNVAGWRENLATSVAENFFGAIHEGKLEVNIDGRYSLDKTTISAFLRNKTIREAVEKHKNEPEQFDNCGYYLEALQDNPEVIVEESEVLHLGLCQIRILLREGLPKKVCMLRNGMFISDSLALPGLKNFSDFKEFIAVVECKNKKGIELLRSMEPPRHDDFEPERLATKDEQNKGGMALNKLAAWIRNMLKRHAKNPVTETTSLDELKEYFADEEGEGGGKGTAEVDPSGKIIIRAKRIVPKKEAIQGEEAESAIGNDGEEAEGGGGNDGGGGGDGSGGKGAGAGGVGGADDARKPSPIAAFDNVRAIVKSPTTRRIFLTPMARGKISVALLEVGADSDYHIAVKTSSLGEVADGKITIDVKPKERIDFEVTLSEAFNGAIKVLAHEV
ncbi:hypothetical protein [Rhodoferax sp. BAB1]|uniref:hypothetical protein n=1 Tax=Rhodoferax sp. BAB1 TaxID=2741720 RepID=UPI00157614B4|nr:hypothetical protein [Rhodoferax sp. BAB1]QKO21976.1 hypothetical protein HTY51_08775 [Rhodoferax sp. BAB1]